MTAQPTPTATRAAQEYKLLEAWVDSGYDHGREYHDWKYITERDLNEWAAKEWQVVSVSWAGTNIKAVLLVREVEATT